MTGKEDRELLHVKEVMDSEFWMETDKTIKTSMICKFHHNEINARVFIQTKELNNVWMMEFPSRES
jgi:hypothetical protein